MGRSRVMASPGGSEAGAVVDGRSAEGANAPRVWLLWTAVGGNERDGADYWSLVDVFATQAAADARNASIGSRFGPRYVEERQVR